MKRLFASGLYVKFTADCGLVAPPLVAREGDIDDICTILEEVLADI